jgi:hypothetical protein
VLFQPGSSERRGDADARLAELILARVPSVARSLDAGAPSGRAERAAAAVHRQAVLAVPVARLLEDGNYLGA